MKWPVAVVLCLCVCPNFESRAQTPAEAEVRKELETLFEPSTRPRPAPSQVMQGLVQKHGRQTVADLAIEPLTAALNGTNYQMREQVAWALFELKDPRSVGPLISFLQVEKFGDWAAEKALIAIGEPALTPLIEAFRSQTTNGQFREKAAKVLGELRHAKAVEPLLEGLASNDRSLPRVCAEALGKVGGASAVDGLIAALASNNPVAKRYAAQALGQVKDPRAVPALMGLLTDRERDFRSVAAAALGEIGDPSAVDALVQGLADPKLSTEREICDALSKMRNSASPVLVNRFREAKEPAERKTLLRALTWMGDPAVEVMIATLEDGDAETRRTALQSLHAMSTPTVAAQTVSQAKQQRAREAILAHYEAGKADEIHFPERVNIIASIKEPRAVQLTLRTLKKKEEGYDDCPWYVPQDIFIAFEKADSYVVDPLIESLADPDLNVRTGAAAMLGHIPIKQYGRGAELEAITTRIGDALARVVTDSNQNEWVRQKGIWSLGRIDDRRHIQTLVALVKDKKAPLGIRRAAIQGFIFAQDQALVAPFMEVFRDKSDDPYLRVEAARVLSALEQKYRDASVSNAFRTVKFDRNEPAAVRAAARTTREAIDRLSSQSALLKAANSGAQPVPHGKQVWPNGAIQSRTAVAERTLIQVQGQGTGQEVKAWYDKQFADWKVYKDWNQSQITAMFGEGEWKVWIRQNTCCLVAVQEETKGRIRITHAFDREEELQDLLAAIPREKVDGEKCKRNLQAIDSAKGQARRKFKLESGATVDPAQLSPLIPGGYEALVCPSGGKYTAGSLDKPSRCSVHGTQMAIGRR
jgi:HEAT repeat protein